MNRNRCKFGFSLPELLIVLGLVSICMGFLLPAVSRARQQAESVRCRMQLQDLGRLIAIYSNENRGTLPSEAFSDNPYKERLWPELITGQVHPPTVICPTGIDSGENLSYMLNTRLLAYKVRVSERIRDCTHSEVVLLGENKRGSNKFHGTSASHERFRHGQSRGTNYLWLDLHVSNDEPLPRSRQGDPWYARPHR